MALIRHHRAANEGRFCEGLMPPKFLLLTAHYLLFTSVVALAQPQQAEPKAETKPPVVKVADGVYEVGKARVDAKRGEVTVTGEVNMNDGLVELLACTRKGKTHESVLVLDVEPIHLQVALLLLGLKAGRSPSAEPKPDTTVGDMVEIWVEWGEGASKQRCRAEELIHDETRKQPMQKTDWVFTGSKIVEGDLLAQLEGSLVATFRDIYALVENPLPAAADDEVCFANKARVPKPGTAVKVVFRKPSTLK